MGVGGGVPRLTTLPHSSSPGPEAQQEFIRELLAHFQRRGAPPTTSRIQALSHKAILAASGKKPMKTWVQAAERRMKTTVDNGMNFNQSQRLWRCGPQGSLSPAEEQHRQLANGAAAVCPTLCSGVTSSNPPHICSRQCYCLCSADEQTAAWGDEGQDHTSRKSRTKSETQTELIPKPMLLPPLHPWQKESAGFGDKCLAGAGSGGDSEAAGLEDISRGCIAKLFSLRPRSLQREEHQCGAGASACLTGCDLAGRVALFLLQSLGFCLWFAGLQLPSTLSPEFSPSTAAWHLISLVQSNLYRPREKQILRKY